MKVYLSAAVIEQCVKDAEAYFVSRGGDLAKLRAKQDKRMRGERELGDEAAREAEAEHFARKAALKRLRQYDVPIGEFSYRVQAATGYDAFKAARVLHEAAGRPRPSARNWLARVVAEG